jgi:hypothetical protein
MCQANNKIKSINVKTSHKVAGLFLFVSVFTVTSAQANNKQDVAELEAFYKQIFVNKKKAVTKKPKNKNIPITKDPELVAFYNQVFTSKQKSASRSVPPRLKSTKKARRKRDSGATLRPLTKATPKVLTVKRKKTSTSSKLQGLINELSNTGGSAANKKSVERPKKEHPTIIKAALTSVQNEATGAPQKVAKKKYAKSDTLSNKDPELVAFYDQVFGKEHLSHSESSQIESLPEIKKSKQAETIAESLANVTEPIVTANVTKHTPAPAKLQDLIDDLSQTKIPSTNIKTTEKSDTQPASEDVIASSSQNTDTSALHTQNIVDQKDLPISSDEPSNSQNSDLDALFAKAFGKKLKSLPSEINVDLRINKESLGEVPVYSNKQRNKIDKVQTETLLALLEDILKEHVFKRTKDEISKTDKVTFYALKKLGIVATYNSSELSLDLQIDSALRKPRVLTLRKRSNGFTRDENKIKANETSAFVNMYSNIGLNSGTDPDLKLKLESSINLRGTTLESDATYINEKWSPGDSRLTYDDPDKLKRYVLGDISTGNRNFQENLQLQGLRLSKEFFMDPELFP